MQVNNRGVSNVSSTQGEIDRMMGDHKVQEGHGFAPFTGLRRALNVMIARFEEINKRQHH
jgi:hypothetical protein